MIRTILWGNLTTAIVDWKNIHHILKILKIYVLKFFSFSFLNNSGSILIDFLKSERRLVPVEAWVILTQQYFFSTRNTEERLLHFAEAMIIAIANLDANYSRSQNMQQQQDELITQSPDRTLERWSYK